MHDAGDDHHDHQTGPGPGVLRGRGRRVTRQRRLIWAALSADPDAHLSAQQIVDHVREELPTVNPSTVYRTLELLVDEGLLLRTHLGADRAYYEPARDHAHHHVVCEDCGAVAHLHTAVLGDLASRVDASSGYELGGGEVTLFGRCPACRG